MSEQDWVADENHKVDVSFVPNQWNCFDESALETMLKLSDSSESFGVVFRLYALTLGNALSDRYLKTLYALGYEEAIRIEPQQQPYFCPEAVATCIEQHITNRGNYDMILMGAQSADEDNSKVPLLVAEALGWPCITQVSELSPVDETHIRVTCTTDEGMVTQTVPTPCVCTVGNSPNSYLRVPTLKDRMKLGKKPVTVIPMEELLLSCEESDCQLQTMEPVVYGREGIIIPGESVEEKVNILYEDYLKGRLKQDEV